MNVLPPDSRLRKPKCTLLRITAKINNIHI